MNLDTLKQNHCYPDKTDIPVAFVKDNECRNCWVA